MEVINHSSLNITAGSEDYGRVAYYAKEVHTGESKIVKVDDCLFYTYDGVNYLLGYVGDDTDLVLPDSYNGESYEIYKYAFYKSSNLTSVVIPDSVTSIGRSAFVDCDSLTSVVIPDSVTSIGENAFYHCSNLASVVIGDSVTSIGDLAFYDCSKLVEVINHSSLDITAGSWDYGSVAYYAKEVHTGESKIVNVDDYLFYTYDGVNYLLGYVGNDTDLVLSDSYNGESYEIYKFAFYNCDSLTSVVIPDSVTSIGEDAFYNCESLTSVSIGDSVTGIGDSAFEDCTSLTSVVIPNSVTSIGEGAFAFCYDLTSAVIPSSVETIGDYAFRYCSSLTSVTFEENSRLLSIGDDAFSYCRNLTSVVIPDSVTNIGSSAFSGCDSLTSVVIGDSVTSIGERAFWGCSKLVEVINHSSLDITAGSWDYGYVALYAKEVHTGESKIVNVDDYLFYTYDGVNYLLGYVGNDTDLVLPGSYNGESYVINQYAFYSCDSLTSVVIGDSVTGIGEYAFYNCTSLTSVAIPDSVTSIGDRAFEDCFSLTSIVIPDSVTSIGYDAFNNCNNLTDVYYTGTEEEWAAISIGSNNSKLTSATIHYNYVPEE